MGVPSPQPLHSPSLEEMARAKDEEIAAEKAQEARLREEATAAAAAAKAELEARWGMSPCIR